MNGSLIQAALWLAALGSALVGGVFFAFSSFVMRALGNLPPAQGLAAMQAINRSVLGSLFLGVFLFTAVAAVGVAALALCKRGPGALPALAGAVLFVAGSFAVTAVVNVPLNNSIASLDPAQADSAERWTGYLRVWTSWNHLRTIASLLALASFILALQAGARPEAQP